MKNKLYWFRRKWINPWYYPIKNYFRPHNVLRIRNTPRSWNDRSERVLHAVFSMLCDFVEREHSHEDGDFRGRVKMLEEEAKNSPAVMEFYYKRDKEILDLYDWYINTDWKNPAGEYWGDGYEIQDNIRKEQEWALKEQEMLRRAIETRESWWT